MKCVYQLVYILHRLHQDVKTILQEHYQSICVGFQTIIDHFLAFNCSNTIWFGISIGVRAGRQGAGCSPLLNTVYHPFVGKNISELRAQTSDYIFIFYILYCIDVSRHQQVSLICISFITNEVEKEAFAIRSDKDKFILKIQGTK